MEFEFNAPVIEWRGPAPFLFIPVPPDPSAEIKHLSPQLTYGWGAIPAEVDVNGFRFTTSLFPKDGIYLVPLKKAVREATGLTLGKKAKVAIKLSPK